MLRCECCSILEIIRPFFFFFPVRFSSHAILVSVCGWCSILETVKLLSAQLVTGLKILPRHHLLELKKRYVAVSLSWSLSLSLTLSSRVNVSYGKSRYIPAWVICQYLHEWKKIIFNYRIYLFVWGMSIPFCNFFLFWIIHLHHVVCIHKWQFA